MKINRKNIARVLAFGAAAALLFIAGCRQDMQNEPKMIPQRGTNSLPTDVRRARRSSIRSLAASWMKISISTRASLTARTQDAMPYPVTLEVLVRGQERFNVYCTPCHSRVGNGDGMIVQRGYKPAGNYHDAKRLAQPLSHYFFVMTNGYGAMPDYSAQITPVDRWAVAAYIRALQLSQNAKLSDVPAGSGREPERHRATKGLPTSYAGPWPVAKDTDVQALPPQEKLPELQRQPAECDVESAQKNPPVKTRETNQLAGNEQASH